MGVGDVVAVDGDYEVPHRAKVLENRDDNKVKVFLPVEDIAGSFQSSRIYKLPDGLGLAKFVAGSTPLMAR